MYVMEALHSLCMYHHSVHHNPVQGAVPTYSRQALKMMEISEASHIDAAPQGKHRREGASERNKRTVRDDIVDAGSVKDPVPDCRTAFKRLIEDDIKAHLEKAEKKTEKKKQNEKKLCAV